MFRIGLCVKAVTATTVMVGGAGFVARTTIVAIGQGIATYTATDGLIGLACG